jgi:hypothetical protein
VGGARGHSGRYRSTTHEFVPTTIVVAMTVGANAWVGNPIWSRQFLVVNNGATAPGPHDLVAALGVRRDEIQRHIEPVARPLSPAQPAL